METKLSAWFMVTLYDGCTNPVHTQITLPENFWNKERMTVKLSTSFQFISFLIQNTKFSIFKCIMLYAYDVVFKIGYKNYIIFWQSKLA